MEDTDNITPAPVSTPEELIAKLDMILGATRQWIADDDDALAAIIYRRTSEIPHDLVSVEGTPEHWEIVKRKAADISIAFQQKTYVNLQAMNSLN
jgi:hypothetical protein